ncbi:MAG: alpha/beta fold hydrolase [bacterium]|jgi:fermentation-respiration switch protein FrsA (DUF1100 family)
MRKTATVLLICLLTAMAACSPPSPGPEELTQRATAAVVKLAAGDYAAVVGEFDKTMKKVLPAPELAAAWEKVIARAGEFRSVSNAEYEEVVPNRQVKVTGEFERADYYVRFVYDRAGKVAGLWIEAVPLLPDVSPDQFTEQDVSIGNEPWRLPGTLTLPRGEGPFPAVVMVHGSGPNDRDETIGPNKPFRDLAWGLAARGVATLRYDKRTKVYAGEVAGDYDFTVWQESIEDAVLAVEFLRGRPEIAGNRIFVLGHSLGGMLIPRIGAMSEATRGFIIMAGLTRRLVDVMVEQYNYLFALDGTVTPEEEKTLGQLTAEVAKVKDLYERGTAGTGNILGAPEAYWLDLRDYDPPAAAAGLGKPQLVLQGERDYQVTMVDFRNWEAALGSKPGVRLLSYPRLNHLFLEGDGVPNPDEYMIAGNVPEYVIDDIAAWVNSAE